MSTTDSIGGPDHIARLLSHEDLSILALEDERVAGHTCKVIVLDEVLELERLRALIRVTP